MSTGAVSALVAMIPKILGGPGVVPPKQPKGPELAAYQRSVDGIEKVLSALVGGRVAVARDWSVGGRFKADIAFLDPKTDRPLALFEVRTKRDPKAVQGAVEQLRSFRTALGNVDIPLYVVVGAIPPEFYRVPAEGAVRGLEELVQEKGLPDPGRLLTRGRASTQATQRVERRSTVKLFMAVCWILAAILVVVLVLDLVGTIELTPARLSLIGAIAGLVIIPFAGKLKVLGLEFERASEGGAGGGGGGKPGLPDVGGILPEPAVPSPDLPLPGRTRKTLRSVKEAAETAEKTAEATVRLTKREG